MKKSFDEIVLFARTGLNPRTNFKLGQGNNKYITIKNIHNNQLLVYDDTDVVDDESLALIHKRSQIKKGDILFCSIGRMGDMYIIPDEPEGWDINESVFAFTLDTRIIRQKYFYYMFKRQSTLDYLSRNSSGSTFKSIKMNQLKRMVFDIPSLHEQDAIISTLDNSFSIIEFRRKELERINDLIKARFVEMFGTDEYPQVTIADLVEKKVSTAKKDFSSEDKIKYIDISSIDNKRNQMTGYTEYRLSEAPSRAQQHVIKNDILVSTVRPNLRNVAIITFDDNNLVASSGFCVLRAYKCLPSYLMAIACSDEFTAAMSKVVTGANYPAIKDSDVMDYVVSMPPITLQQDFERFVAQVDKSKLVVQKALDKAQLLFDSLMQKYFG